MNFKIVNQYTVFLPNIPGALSRFIELFHKENINIIGIASEIRDDSGIVKVSVDTSDKISYILTGAGFTTVESKMISIELPNKPGELLRLTRFLGDNNINITTVYGTTMKEDNVSRVLVNVSDVAKTLKLLENFPT